MLNTLQSIPLGYYAFSGLINFITAAIISIVVFLSNKKSNTNRIFAAFSFSVAYWSILYFAWLNTTNKELAEFYLRSCMIGVLFMPSLFIHFVNLFLKREINKKFLIFNYLLSFLFTLTVYTPLYAKDIGPHLVFPYWLHTGILFHFAILHFGTVVLYSFYLMWNGIKTKTGIFRNQILYVFVGTAVGYIAGVTNFFYWYRIGMPPFLNIFVSVYVVMVAVAVLRFRLMDINIAITRTGIFAVVYTFVLGIPFWIGFKFLGKGLWILPVFIMAVLATTGPFIFQHLRKKAEDMLLKDQRRYQEALIELSANLTLIKKLDRLLKFIVLNVTKAVKVEFVCIYIDGRNTDKLIQRFPYTTVGFFPHFPLEIPYNSNSISYISKFKKPIFAEELPEEIKKELNLRAGIIIPSFVRQRILGFLVMGPKSSGAMYSPEDVMVFRILSAQVGLAIENTQFIKEYEEVQAKLREAEKLKGIAQLMHSLNHELLNLFNKMSMPIQLIMMGDIDLNDKVNFENTLKTINDAMETSIEILGFISTYRNKSKSQESKATKIEEAINNAVNHFSKRFQEANIQIIKNMQPDLPAIQAKETFGELFINILANSYFALIDKTQGERLIEIQAKLSEDKNTTQIRMSDTGPDMTKSTYMCDKDSPFKERGKIGGVNFGLAYLITNQHDGTLMVESYEKGGTTFTIEIPIKQKGTLLLVP